MDSISEYSARRAAAQDYPDAAALGVQPYAIEHVENLRANGKSALVDRQLLREAQSHRVTDSMAALQNRVTTLNESALKAGYEKFVYALATAKKTKNGHRELQHAKGRSNPVNRIKVEDQAAAVWEAVLSMTGRICDTERVVSIQALTGRIADRLEALANNAPPHLPLAYKQAALLLLLYFCHVTGWLEKQSGGVKIIGAQQKPSRVVLTDKFRSEILGGGGIPIDFGEFRPMLVPPVPWTADAPYGAYLSLRVSAVRRTDEAIRSESIVRALNALQNTPFRINRKVLEIAGSFTLNAETLDGFIFRGHYVEERMDISDVLARSRTIRSALTISAARDLEREDEFYFPWNLDHRGRMYPATSIMSPQGSDLCKGLLEFADGTALGKDGWMWLAITLCNLAGADRKIVEIGGQLSYKTRTKEERVQWTLDHEAGILAVASDALRNNVWRESGGFGLAKIKGGACEKTTVDKPWQFLAACYEWAEYREQGDGFKSRLAGALDGKCSGVQMLSGMTLDRDAGALVGLTAEQSDDDYYSRMASTLNEVLCQEVPENWPAADRTLKSNLECWAGYTIDRDLLKAPSMTKIYSAGTYTFAEQVQAKTGANDTECIWLAKKIDKCFERVVPGMVSAMNYLQAVTDIVTEAGMDLSWKTPAGLQVSQRRVKETDKDISVKAFDITWHLRFKLYTSILDTRKQRAGVSPNFVHGVDASHMVRTINTLYARGVRNFWMIHDSFGAPFAHCNDVFEVTRDEFVMLMSDDLLANWTRDVTACLDDESKKKLPPLPARGNLDLGEVRNSLYAWF